MRKLNLLSHVQLYTVHGILQARILEWVAFLFSRGSSQPRARTQVSCIAGGFFISCITKGNSRILEWVAYPFFSSSSLPRNQIRVSCIAGGFFTSSAIREALKVLLSDFEKNTLLHVQFQLLLLVLHTDF